MSQSVSKEGKSTTNAKSSCKEDFRAIWIARLKSGNVIMEPKLKIKNDEDGEKVDPTEYRRVVGYFRYLTNTLHFGNVIYGCNYMSFHGGTGHFAFPVCESHLIIC